MQCNPGKISSDGIHHAYLHTTCDRFDSQHDLLIGNPVVFHANVVLQLFNSYLVLLTFLNFFFKTSEFCLPFFKRGDRGSLRDFTDKYNCSITNKLDFQFSVRCEDSLRMETSIRAGFFVAVNSAPTPLFPSDSERVST